MSSSKVPSVTAEIVRPLTNGPYKTRIANSERRGVNVVIEAGVQLTLKAGGSSVVLGPDGVSSATASMAPYTMQVYKDIDPGYGFPSIPWISPTGAWRAFQQAPALQRADRLAQRTPAHAQLLREHLFPQLVAGPVSAAEDELFELLHDAVGQNPAFVRSRVNFC